jgi:hypothetical protein
VQEVGQERGRRYAEDGGEWGGIRTKRFLSMKGCGGMYICEWYILTLMCLRLSVCLCLSVSE